MDALDHPALVKEALETCGARCAEGHVRGLAKVRSLYRETGDLDAVVAEMQRGAHGFGLRCEGEVVYLTYGRCFCSLVRAATQPISPTYCHCSCGYTRAVWESILGHPVTVTLLHSVVAGEAECLQAIDTHLVEETVHD